MKPAKQMQSPKSGFWGLPVQGQIICWLTMQLLAQTRAAGVDGVIVDKNNKIRLLEGSYTLKRETQFGEFVSLIPVTQALKALRCAVSNTP